MNFDHKAAGQTIAALRTEKGLSQEVLSGLAGLDRTHYSKIERGLRSPTLGTPFRIAAALDVPPHEIVQSVENAMAHGKEEASDSSRH